MVVTLVVLALTTILVVSLASMISSERITTHESFENQRTRELAGIAVDEVVAMLHDNIPTNTIWAVAPGRLTYMTNGAFSTVLLCSGVAAGTASGTGQVDLNAPILGSSPTSYPIASPNTEYPTAPQMPVAWVEVLQDGTLIRSGVTPTETPSKSNPIVGRYAYWVDTETSKANINTAGRGQTTYNFTYDPISGNFPASGNDLQNLTASPSRLDLSQLDGNITTNQSDATFHYTYGSYWLPDSGDVITIGAPHTSTNVPVYPQGMHRFNSIADWAQLPTTDSLFSGTSVTAITNTTQVEPNKFYLTTHSRTPDLTPWGYNKMWLEFADENVTASGLAFMGNRLNGKGAPAYPSSSAMACTNFPGSQEGISAAEPRYYYTPYIKQTSPAADLVELGRYEGSMQGIANFVNNMMVQLNRTDWPGFQGKSFTQKYGQRECEDLAYNLLCMYDETVRGYSAAPEVDGAGHDSRNYSADWKGIYGGRNFFGQDAAGNDISTSFSTEIDQQKGRMLGGIGEWPYMNEVSVAFQGATGASATGCLNTTNWPAAEPFAASVIPISGDPPWPTKFPDHPAFACQLSAVDTSAPAFGCNIKMIPNIQVVYPPGFQNPFYSGYSQGSAGYSEWMMCDIAVYATGTFNGQAVTYGSKTLPDNEIVLAPPNGRTGQLVTANYCPYYWGPCDNFTTNSGSSYGYYYNTTNLDQRQEGGFQAGLNPLVEIDSTNSPQTIPFPPIYIGPFSFGTTVTDIQLRARFVHIHQGNAWVPLEIAPLAYNFPSALTSASTPAGSPLYPLPGTPAGSGEFFAPSANNENECFTNLIGSTGPNGQPYSPTFVFEVTGLKTGDQLGQNVTYDLGDPRVYRYTNDWTMRKDTIGITPVSQAPGSTSPVTDPITGITGDSSKFAWPNVGLSYYDSGYETQFLGLNQNATLKALAGSDGRHYQYANNIQGLPGIGWLSFLPLNCESSQGSPSSTGGSGVGASATSGTPIPWRTLSLEANQKAGTLIPDWILLEAFGVAYDQTFCSHTEGKLNVNTSVTAAFPAGTTIAPRTKPLAALIDPSSYPAAGTNTLAPMSPGILTSITNAIAGGPANPGSLPSDIFMYPGQLCELNLQSTSGATNQLQRESLMRDLIGTLTTQSSDFLVHVVAQSVKQINFNATINPATDLQVTSEQRMSALVSRLPNLGPDNIPDSGWTNASQNLSGSLADENATTGVTNTISAMTVTTGITNTWVTSAPTFRYTVSDLQYANGQ